VKNALYFIKNIKQVGAVAPSSKFLAQKMAGVLDEEIERDPERSFNLLELGSGTGSMSRYIYEHMRDQDHLDMVEIEKPLYEQLVDRYKDASNVDVFNTDYLHFDSKAPYDIIFSSLPYEGIPNEQTEDIWQKKLDECKSGGRITYFKYLNFKSFRCDFEEHVVDNLKQRQDLVWLNLPPARLFVLELDEEKVNYSPAIA